MATGYVRMALQIVVQLTLLKTAGCLGQVRSVSCSVM